MSWYDEKISIKRGTIFNIWGTALFMLSLGSMIVVMGGLILNDIPFIPEVLMCFVVLIQQFLLSAGLIFSMQTN